VPEPATILVADDEEDLRLLVRSLLEWEGYHVVEAATGPDALACCRQPDIDLALLDVQLPGLTGYEVLRELQRDARTSYLPVVLLTAQADPGQIARGLSSGAADYVAKPFDSRELIARIRAALRLKRLHDELLHKNAELDLVARIDPLTRLYNRLHMEEQLASQAERAGRRGEPLSVMIVDVDHFKRINDRYGHASGDLVLKTVAERLASSFRRSDVLARWGGEEFLALLPDTGLEEAMAIAERARIVVARQVGIHGPWVTVSIGVATMIDSEPPHHLVGRADSALYEAKESGRNTVRAHRGGSVAPPPPADSDEATGGPVA
jgi:two-component system cell cycle response regulator